MQDETFENVTDKRVNVQINDPNRMFYLPQPFALQGRNIFFKKGESFKKIFKLKTTVMKMLKDCAIYEKNETYPSYSACRDQEMKNIFEPKIGCIPPIFTEVMDGNFTNCQG